MDNFHLNALRFGFSTKEAAKIQNFGLRRYISDQLSSKNELVEPAFLSNSPKSLVELKEIREQANKNDEDLKNFTKNLNKSH